MKKILGLDLGTNSIGWAIVNAEIQKREDGTDCLKPVGIDMAGSRIIPMDASVMGDFEAGNSVSQTADRTRYRGMRRLRERFLLRRERLNRVLDHMNFLPDHYSSQLDRYGKFISHDVEPKLAWRPTDDGKYKFIFMESFLEMVEDFKVRQPEIWANNKQIPLDWTIYYLRKKALTEKISNEELAWILLQFNQKRGYYQARGEEEEEKTRQAVEYYSLNVVKVEDSGDKRGQDVWYNVYLENGWIYRRCSRYPLDWVGKKKDFIVTTPLDEKGNPQVDKDGNVKRTFRAPGEDDWTLQKKKTEAEIEQVGYTVGEYIYDSLLHNPSLKIKGKLIRTIEREFYRKELQLILEKQMEFNKTLADRELYQECVELLYPSNVGRRNELSRRDFGYLFVNDIIFYQRPLKSKKSLISDCPFEKQHYRDPKTGLLMPLKCVSKSHPLYQEFRLWQFVNNLKIYERSGIVDGILRTERDVTTEFLPNDDMYVELFDFLNNRSSITQDALLCQFLGIKKPRGKESVIPYRWNYVENKEYPCNETRAAMLAGFQKAGIAEDLLTRELTESLWHVLYSVSDKQELVKALKKFSDKHQLGDSFVSVFAKSKPYDSDYGAYSLKATKKLLALMRKGKYWDYDAIDINTKGRINKIINGEFDEDISLRIRDKFKTDNQHSESDFKGLPLWKACYVVYDISEKSKWERPEDIDDYLSHFKQHSLRNPIVEQVVLETLRTVRDIWKRTGTIDEIHIELGRDLKNPASDRREMTQRNIANENTNLRIKALLSEFVKPEYGIENVRPNSPMQQDKLRIFEEYVLNNKEQGADKDSRDFVEKMSITSSPSSSDIMRYRLWLEQRYVSPYTGKVIPLSKLFTPDYEIEHIIPQSKYFDDSFSNKVICESEVNKLKDRQLGYEFVKSHSGEKVQISRGETVEVFSKEAYEAFVRSHYSGAKLKKLLMDDISDEFINRQMNDSRYISRLVKGLLSNIVREKDENGEYEQEEISKNVIPCSGPITDYLKNDWGVNEVWNSIILPRYKRLNELTGRNCFTTINSQGHEIPAMPLELQKGYKKKRIDHRHHAMDAIVIACTTREHVNLLNNEAAKSENKANRYQLSKKLRRYERIQIGQKTADVAREFKLPWPTFPVDTKNALLDIVVSFKQNVRVLTQTTNHYFHYDENGEKFADRQIVGGNVAVRKALHKETVYGLVNLKKIKPVKLVDALSNPSMIVDKELKKRAIEMKKNGLGEKQILTELSVGGWNLKDKVDVFYFSNDTKERYYATRKALDPSFDEKTIVNSVTDTGIQKILLTHLNRCDGNAELAFGPDGIDRLNRDIVALNDGHWHQPIYKVRKYEEADKFPVGQRGNKGTKYVEAAKGTCLFFAVYKKETVDRKTGEIVVGRSFDSIPLNVVIERLKQHLSPVPDTNEEGEQLLFFLKPNDLVYLPTSEELESGHVLEPLNRGRVYRFVDPAGNNGAFTPHSLAKVLFSLTSKEQKKMGIDFIIQDELGLGSPRSKNNRALTGEIIKDNCIPLKVDRLGNIHFSQEL